MVGQYGPFGPEGTHDLLGGREAIAGTPGSGLHEPLICAPGEDGRLFEVIVVQREDRPVDDALLPMTGATDPLDEPAHLVWGAELDHVVDPADVDPELEGGGGHQRAKPALPERPLGLLAHLARERPVMHGDGEVGGQPTETGCQPLGGGSGVDEDEGGRVRPDLFLHGP